MTVNYPSITAATRGLTTFATSWLAPYYRFKVRPVWQDDLSCCYQQNKNRFQAMSRSGNPGPDDTLMRCVQGHSGHIANQSRSRLAHTPITNADECPTLDHYTKTKLLPKIIGWEMPGLLPGGRKIGAPSQEGRRSHVHMSKQLVTA